MRNLFGTVLMLLIPALLGSCSDDDNENKNANYVEDNTTDVAVTGAVLNKTATTATINGFVNLNLLPSYMAAVKGYGIAYESVVDESGDDFDEDDRLRADKIVGRSITVCLKELRPNQTYRYCTYLELSDGMKYYGECKSFKTDDFTNLISNPKVDVEFNKATITATLAYDKEWADVLGDRDYDNPIGVFLSDNKTELDNPFTEDMYVKDNINNYRFSFLEKGEGEYTNTVQVITTVKNLDFSKTYYYRTYTMIYDVPKLGEIKSFTTDDLSKLPNIFSNLSAEPSYNSAVFKATLDYDKYDRDMMEIGFVWSTQKADIVQGGNFKSATCNPYYDDYGKYYITTTASGLENGTTYYYCAYTKAGSYYKFGTISSFKTKEPENSTFTANGVSFTMVYVQGGTFTMGATSEQGTSDSNNDEKPTHRVTLSSYYIGQTEVTQALWQAVMGNNPSYFTGNSNRPVEKASWDDCQTFISKLNSLTGQQFRLPTEAEWEFAARGGNNSRGYKYSGSNYIDNVAWYDKNASVVGSSSSNYGTHRVATKSANELGIYDMSGNVYEWCNDWYGSNYYGSSPSNNPQGPSSGSYRVLRGGSWLYGTRDCRVSFRIYNFPDNRYCDIGLRLSL